MDGFGKFIVVYLIVVVVGVIGWGINIVKLTKCDFKAPYKTEILRVIGIPVAPMGAVIGFMNMEDK